MEPIIECGIARNPGDAMAWSDGEVSLGPVIGTTHGTPVSYTHLNTRRRMWSLL